MILFLLENHFIILNAMRTITNCLTIDANLKDFLNPKNADNSKDLLDFFNFAYDW